MYAYTWHNVYISSYSNTLFWIINYDMDFPMGLYALYLGKVHEVLKHLPDI